MRHRMRRAPAQTPLSPQLIKHFAFATVALTGLLAMFATGEDWGAQAQIKAVDDRNQLEITEVNKLGTKRLAAKLQTREGPAPADFSAESAIDFNENTFSDRHAPARRMVGQNGLAEPYGATGNPREPAANLRTIPINAPPIPGIAAKPVPSQPQLRPDILPNAEQIAALKAKALPQSAGAAGD